MEATPKAGDGKNLHLLAALRAWFNLKFNNKKLVYFYEKLFSANMAW